MGNTHFEQGVGPAVFFAGGGGREGAIFGWNCETTEAARVQTRLTSCLEGDSYLGDPYTRL